MRKHYLIFIVILVTVFVIAACTPGENTAMDIPSPDGKVAGFLLGIWHGIIAPVTFIISLFTAQISMYEVHNNGGWYDFGFVLGASILFGGSGRASKK